MWVGLIQSVDIFNRKRLTSPKKDAILWTQTVTPLWTSSLRACPENFGPAKPSPACEPWSLTLKSAFCFKRQGHRGLYTLSEVASEKRSVKSADQEKAGKKWGKCMWTKKDSTWESVFSKSLMACKVHTHTHTPNTYSQNPGLTLGSYLYLFSGLPLQLSW